MTLEEQMQQLRELQVGWDTYGGHPPNEKTIQKAAELARATCAQFSYPPSLVPCSDGGIQVEWHCDGWDIEIYVTESA